MTGVYSAISTRFVRVDAPLLIDTADLPQPKRLATSATSSALALPSTGGDFNCADHVPLASWTSDEVRALGLTLTVMTAIGRLSKPCRVHAARGMQPSGRT